jgi:tetratricopeptide (TPR) repeat protein
MRLLLLTLLLLAGGSAAPADSDLGQLLPVPSPDIAGTEPAVHQTLESARNDLDALVAATDTDPALLATAFGEMGELYHAHHVYIPAGPCYENASRLDPKFFRWPYYHGYLMQQTSQPERALASYRRALTLRPDYAPARLRLAEAYLDLGQPEQAEPLFRELLSVPAIADAARYGLGRLLLSRGDAAGAAELFERVLQAQPDATKVHYSLGMAYRALGDIEQARAQLTQRGDGVPGLQDPEIERLDQLSTGLRILLYQAIAAVHAGHHEQAVSAFRQALEQDPDNDNARVSLARSLYIIGQTEASRAELQRVLDRDPAQALANFFLGVWLRAAGDDTAARGYFQTALATDPAHGGAHHFLANDLMRQGEYAEAAHHYAAAVTATPENGPAWAEEAAARLRAGEPHQEIVLRLEQGRLVAPGFAPLQLMLARLLAASPEPQTRDGARALALAEALFERQNLLENAETLAMAYAEVGRLEDAAALQQNAFNAAAAAGRFELLPRQQTNLDHYREGRACRAPFGSGDPLLYPMPIDPHGVFREYPTKAAY